MAKLNIAPRLIFLFAFCIASSGRAEEDSNLALVYRDPIAGCNGYAYGTNGAFSWNRSTRISQVTDGTSNTIAFGERSKISGWGIWPGVGSNRFENDVATDVSFSSVLNNSMTGFSSAHEGGVHFGMMDGNVRFIANKIDSKPEGGILQFLGNRADSRDVASLINATSP